MRGPMRWLIKSLLRPRALLPALMLAAAPAAQAGEAAAWAALKAGGHVALMRHAEAPGIGDPDGFRLRDCATQRNLDARGRDEARAAGDRLRAERVAIGRVLSSPWCRCRETAELMRTGSPVDVTPVFGSAFGDGGGRSGQLVPLDEARRVMRGWGGPGTLLVVTHGATIRALLDGPNPATAEAVVVKPSAGGSLVEVGRLRLAAPRP
jgi:phosphohistidine phosphatase SixA